MIVNISASDVSAMLLLEDIHFWVSKAADKDTHLRVPEVNKKNVTSISCVKVIFPKDAVIQCNSCRFVDKTSHIQLCDLGSIENRFPFLLSEVSGDCYHSWLVVEVILVYYLFEFIQIGCEDLLGVERLLIALIIDLEGYFVVFRNTLGRAEFLLCSKEWVLGG